MKKRIISLLLSAIILATSFCLPLGNVFTAKAEAASTILVAEDGSYTMPAITIVTGLYRAYYTMMRLFTGDENYSAEHYNLVVDEMFTSIMTKVYEECGIDFSLVWNNLPETNGAAELITTTFKLDIPATQEKLNAKCHELEAQGKPLLGAIVRLVSAWLGVVDKCYLTCEETEDPDVVELVVFLTYRDGRVDCIHSPIYYNKETETFTSKDGGPVFLGFYFDAGNAATYTDKGDVWQRKMGYTFLYDLICYANPFFVGFSTQRIKFVYDNKQYMVQVWKGRYFLANGAEIGLYTRDINATGTYYNAASDEEMIPMSLKLEHGDEVYFDIPLGDAWWISEFKLSRTAYLPKYLTLTSTLTMTDTEMLEAFTGALDNNSNISYTVDGMDVTIVW